MSDAAARFTHEALQAFVTRALVAVGMPAADAAVVASLMVSADLGGAEGHGVFRLPQYVRRIRAGGINLHPNIRVDRERDATARVDGHNGMGHLVMKFAADVAIEKARCTGVGWVGVHHGN